MFIGDILFVVLLSLLNYVGGLLCLVSGSFVSSIMSYRVFCLRCVQVLVLLSQLTDFHWCFVFLVILNLHAQANVQGGNGKSRH